MPRPRFPYLHREVTRHCRVVWYVHVRPAPRVRIRADYGTTEFAAEYHAAIAGEAPAPATKTRVGSLRWLIDTYRGSSSWAALSAATRRQRENIFKHVVASAGDVPFDAITRKKIIEGRENRKNTPAQANCFLKAMRGLFQWAVKDDVAAVDPTRDVGRISFKSDGFHAWTEEEVGRFEQKWPCGTRERVAFDVLLYTGLRRGDAVRLGRQHVRDGIFRIRTEKTGTEIEAPILPALAHSLAQGPTGDLAFIVGDRGRPMVKESFGTWFRAACVAAGVPGSAHGLRKAGAARAACNGATAAQLDAIFGWSGGRMASLYTKSADRARLARGAMELLGDGTGAERSISSPRILVRTRMDKK